MFEEFEKRYSLIIGNSKIEKILNDDEEMIHKLENTKFPKNASWAEQNNRNKYGEQNNTYHGKIYLTNMRIIFGGFGPKSNGSDGWYYPEKIITINLEKIVQFKYSIASQSVYLRNCKEKWTPSSTLVRTSKFKSHWLTKKGEEIHYTNSPYGPELLIGKQNGKSERFILPKDYSDLKVSELKEKLEELDLPLSGKKTDLIDRLKLGDGNDPTIVEKLENHRKDVIDKMTTDAKECEISLDYDTAVQVWEKLGKKSEAARVRKLKAEQRKVDQTIVHGDYVDDRDTIVKDSVLNRSNVGGSSKMQDLKDLTKMKKEGLIDDDEFKQMKKEIMKN